MSKIDFTKKTKLDTRNPNIGEKLNILKSQESTHKNKSFRFRSIDIERIRIILEKTNEASMATRFKETDIVRGLLTLGEEISGEKVITYIRKSI